MTGSTMYRSTLLFKIAMPLAILTSFTGMATNMISLAYEQCLGALTKEWWFGVAGLECIGIGLIVLTFIESTRRNDV
jgi:hypothetical protein